MSELDTLRNSSNKKTYPAQQMDSVQAINSITSQKVQDVFDLSSLYIAGNKNTEIDSSIHAQIKFYFYKPDSLTLKPLFKELESLKVKSAKVNNLEVYDVYYKKDTLNFAKFNVEYFDKERKSIGKFDHKSQFILVPAPKKFKKEFKFYFLDFFSKPLNDSIKSGVIK
ncbi:hypothetical protein ACFQH0_01465 [Frigoriflavimonas asaccharolytica]